MTGGDPPGSSTTRRANPRAANALIWTTCTLGLVTLLASLLRLPRELSWPYVLTWAITVLCGAFPLALSRGQEGTSLSVVTAGIFFSLGRFGLAATVPIMAMAAWAITNALKPTKRRYTRLAFNVSALVLASAAGGLAITGLGALGVPPLMATLAAAALYYLVNSLLVAGVVSLTSGMPFVRHWRDTCLLAAPPFLVWALSGWIAATSLREPHDALVGLIILGVVYLTYRSIVSYVTQLQDRSRLAEEASALNLRIAESLTLAIASPAGFTYDELRALQACGRAAGASLGLDADRQRELALAILLRDIGLLAIPRDLRESAPRTLSDVARLHSHPTLAVEMLADAGLPESVLAAIAAHHEHWDGTGYPDGLAGERIPLLARIVGVIDHLEGLRHPGGGAVPCPASHLGEALAQHAGTRFDPAVVRALTTVLADAPLAQAVVRPVADGSVPPPRTGVFQVISAVQRETRVIDELALALQGAGGLEPALRLSADALASLAVPVRRLEFTSIDGEVTAADTGATPADAGASAGVPGGVDCSLRLSVSAEGLPMGTLTMTMQAGVQPMAEHQRLFSQVASLITRAIVADRVLQAAQRDASTDQLTGLPNRRWLLLRAADDLERCVVSHLPLTIFLIDLDGFKALNDTCGHAYGDLALRMAADTLRSSIRPCDTVARLGGDEFVVVLPGCHDSDAAARQRALQSALCRIEVDTPSGRMHLGASIGAAHVPGDGDRVEQLLEAADARMYEDKQRRKHAA